MTDSRETEAHAVEGASKWKDASGAARTNALLEAKLGGCPEADRRLIEYLTPPLLLRARSHKLVKAVRKEADPEDVVAEVWFRVIKGRLLVTFTPAGPGSLGAFLQGVLDNVMKDWVRRIGADKRGGAHRIVAVDDAPQAPSVLPSPTGVVRANELRDVCRRILDDREWRVFSSCALDGLTASEVARRLDLADSTVRGIRKRAKEKLRAAIGPVRPETRARKTNR